MIVPSILFGLKLFFQEGFSLLFFQKFFQQTIQLGIRAYMVSVLTFLIFRSDIYLINYFKGLQETGLYSLAVGFGDGILLFVTSVALVLFPKINEDQNHGTEIVLRVSRFISLSVGIIILFTFIFAKLFIEKIFGLSFMSVLSPLYILLPAIYFWSITNIISQWFASKGFPWVYIRLWIPGLLLNIILNLIFIPRYGMIAAASTSLLAYIVNFVLSYKYFKQNTNIRLTDLLRPRFTEIKAIIYRFLRNKT